MPHLALILVIALIVFGPGKIGESAVRLGRGVRELRTNLDTAAERRRRRSRPVRG